MMIDDRDLLRRGSVAVTNCSMNFISVSGASSLDNAENVETGKENRRSVDSSTYVIE